ncbi:chemotaxis protein CheB [Desulfovibrio inopinatus]|uniref:chemotaxis protein CheB n=1 Tax=Desulfovibrio inopinatus TaxID=102109 RepID=UPI000402DFD9|nr:chemotaxis protein CheB [Desulfovibrio inopinatus]
MTDTDSESPNASETEDAHIAPPESSEETPLPVVGIGASAGGFEALESFFKKMPSDSGICFVVVQHLSPDHKSLMVELLSKHTQMKVRQAEEGMPLEANTITLIPPGKIMTVTNAHLHLAEKDTRVVPNYPIDTFFHSLADNSKEHAIGIILSGTGSDGARGIRTIKESNGLIMVQEPLSAKFDGMPQSAVATGTADFILAPEEMPVALVHYINNPIMKRQVDNGVDKSSEHDRLGPLFTIIKNAHGVDFTHYKPSTVFRRIQRRMGINQIDSLDTYITLLYQNEEEVHALYRELLIGVTSFFRDSNVFKALQETVLPELFKNEKRTLRVWVCGCSTGEEAYSLAILFHEFNEAGKFNKEIKIFATDIDKNALEFASNGFYPESISADMNHKRLSKYFLKQRGGYAVQKRIREMVIFASQNIFRDPPFNKIDLLSCRNLLIYFQPVLQERVFSLFSFALNEGGFLLLGASETVGKFSHLFTLVDARWKIYRSTGRQLPLDTRTISTGPVIHQKLSRPTLTLPDRQSESVNPICSSPEILQDLISRYVPPAIVINQNRDVIHFIGDVSPFVQIRPGKASLNMRHLIRKELAIAVETGINKSLRENSEIAYRDIPLKDEDDDTSLLDLVILPYQDRHTGQRIILVLFEKHSAVSTQSAQQHECFDLDAKATERIHDLEQELQYNKENLQATIEEVETTNEELHATNEELLSANEELQSTNEELQSVNEELITVNSEYQNKIHELTELNNDMNNLLSSTNFGVIFLDRNLYVRKFTPAVKDVINLMDFDIGRPIGHISFNIKYNELEKDAHTVLDHLVPITREVSTANGKWLALRILPYMTMDNVIKGVIITFIDITEFKKTSLKLQKFSVAVEESPTAVIITDGNGDIEFANAGVTRMTGYTEDELLGQNIRLFRSQEAHENYYEQLWQQLQEQGLWKGRFHNKKKDGKPYIEEATIIEISEDSSDKVSYLKVSQDITEQERTQEALRNEHRLVRGIADTSPIALAMIDGEDRIVFANTHFEHLFHIDRNTAIGKTLDESPLRLHRYDSGNESNDQLPHRKAIMTGQAQYDVILSAQSSSGEQRALSVNASPLIGPSGSIGGAVVSFEDITSHVRNKSYRELLFSIVQSSDEVVFFLSSEGTISSWSNGASHLYGYNSGEIIGETVSILVSPETREAFPPILDRARQGERIKNQRGVHCHKNGSPIDVTLTLTPTDQENELIAIVSPQSKAQIQGMVEAEDIQAEQTSPPKDVQGKDS